MAANLPGTGGVAPDRGGVGPLGHGQVVDFGAIGDEGKVGWEHAQGYVVEYRLHVLRGVRGGEHGFARVEGTGAAELDEVIGHGAGHDGAVKGGGGLPEGLFDDGKVGEGGDRESVHH